ncbi:uncharacterized protein LOC120079023 isoform X1 [Benincasa hispida]|uniref:uncharacterized protein LOC120079023 isoform X1 n=1 Tax=Benincasa hispida TaxID=102211 RepID=UPI0018FF3306|nr:uncharacterized protein LOC120079023 isoform X1 [Benincasa hispida]XP_038889126.1 uncharacterized protein LOC120079023 isoform X1 [Benincasa hispida]XP_038889128.1 uncharacterized protein LOC120079023 isoform X1 [Benincasa hispida]
MDKNEETGSPGWGASLFLQTTEDVARAVAAAAAAATDARSPRPSVIYSSKDDEGGSPLQRLQRQVNKVLKGFSSPPQVKTAGTYNPEVLTTQKRQWANFQLQYLDHRSQKEPTRIFESMVVVGLHPNCDIQALQRQYAAKRSEGSGRLRTALNNSQSQSRVEPHLEPQVLFVYPPEKQLPLKYKDLLSFCFPGGVEVHAVEKTPSMSELNEILLGQEHFKQSDLSFVFRLQVADDSTLYGCCVLVEELVQKPSGLLSVSEKASSYSSLSRYVLTTRRCYCILSRLPFFELHFGVLNSIFTEERLQRLTKGIGVLNLESSENLSNEEDLVEDIGCMTLDQSAAEDVHEGKEEFSQRMGDENHVEHQMLDGNFQCLEKGVCDDIVATLDPQPEVVTEKIECVTVHKESHDIDVDDFTRNKQAIDRRLPNAVLPLLRYYQYESSESSSSFQGSPSEDRNFRSDADDTETEEASFSGQDDSTDLLDILEWAKENKNGSLQIICEYYQLHYPARGCSVKFHPLEHLHPLEYYRSGKTVLHVAGSTIDPRSCSTSLELAEAQGALMVEEEANALSIWTVASICGSLRLEHILSILAGALLEKQIVIVCSNLGILSASVLSIIPMIRPYQWQSLLMPVLPNDMLDFLDAPVPYIVGVKNKTSEVQSKLANAVLVDVNKNQVKAPTIPQLPKQKELFTSLRPYHAELVGESFLGRKRPVHECTDVQVEAAKGFLKVLRLYLDSLCSNLRSHTITNVQSNDDKVSLLLKESFIESFPSRDRPFLKLFVDTQLFSVHTDLVLSFFQKE